LSSDLLNTKERERARENKTDSAGVRVETSLGVFGVGNGFGRNDCWSGVCVAATDESGSGDPVVTAAELRSGEG
jgi:hypothetical protein